MAFLAQRREQVRTAFAAAASAAIQAGEIPTAPLPAFTLEPPRAGGRGHLACNLALVLAAAVRRAPRDVADALARRLSGAVPDLRDVDVAGPGFVNLTFEDGWLAPVVAEVLRAGVTYGDLDHGQGRRVLVEFVSANPTGPLNVVNCRAAAFGDALVRCLNAAGYRAESEYYVNDAGGQFRRLGQSVEARLRQCLDRDGTDAAIPEGGYPGEYLVDVASAWLEAHGPDILQRPEAERVDTLARFAVDRLLRGQLATLARFGVHYHHVTRESEVRARGGPERVLQGLQAARDAEGRPYAYEQDGALWLRSTAFGDNDDRVLRKRDGEYTYRVPDVAYHLEKFARGFDLLIDLLGQDHHGDVPGVRAGLQILGQPVQQLEVLITQLVRLVRDGRADRVSKREGRFVTMEEFVDQVGVDAARFFFLMHTLDTHMDFDVELAGRQTQDNPVYYVQYAHARICSILRQAAASGVPFPELVQDGTEAATPPLRISERELRLLTHPAEQDLLLRLAAFPDEVLAAAAGRSPHRLTAYARQTAERFHAFYVQCRVLDEAPERAAARLCLCAAARIVLARALGLMGVSAPERM